MEELKEILKGVMFEVLVNNMGRVQHYCQIVIPILTGFVN